MKKYIIIICMILLSAFAAFAQTPGVTHRGEVTKEEDRGTVERRGQVVDCPALTQYGEIISYAATMEALSGSLDGTVNVAVGIQITKADNADSVGFELATDENFLNIVGHISYSNVNTVLYQDTFKNLTPGETYYVRAFIASCPTSVYSDTVDVTTTGFYNLSFFSRGGSGSMTDQSFTHGVSQKINPNEFTRPNADFAGWTTDAAGCGTLYPDSASMTLYSSDSVFAQWKTWCTGIPRSNEKGTSHIDSVKDHQNNWYKVVQIGRQCWLKENLRATTSVNGTPILTNDGSIIAGKRAHPIDELGREGYLYNWPAAMDLPENTVVGTELVKHRGLCPEGWHIPVQAEWDTLFAVAKAGYLAAYNCKIPSTDYYWEPSSVADAPGNDAALDKNIYEFSSIPTGYYSNDRMMLTKSNALYHSATSTSNIVSYVASVIASSAAAHTVVEDSSKLKRGAVRCIRDVSDFVTVTFNDNLGAGTETTQIVQTMTDTVLAANAFTCPNGTFIGWNTDRKGKGTHYEDEAEINLSEDLTLYAQWNRSCVGTALDNEVQNDIYVDSVRDYDGNAYATIRMGSQCWMRSNLKSTKYADGMSITSGISNQELYGRYYNAAVALRKVADTTFAAPSGVQGVCPNGWHLPSIAEWQQMFAFVESNPVFVCGDETVDGILGTGVAKALASDTLWKSTTANSCYPGYALSENNATGFDIRPGGYHNVTNDGNSWKYLTEFAYFWSTTYPNPTNTAKYFNVRIKNDLSYAYQDPASATYRYTVRCVRDIATVLGEIVVDTAACSYIDVHATLDNGSFAPSYSFSIYKDQACTQPADGFKQVTRSADKKMVSARFYDLSANTHYYIRFQYTSAFGTELDTVVSTATTCYCLAISPLNEFERGTDLSGQVRIDSVYDHQGHRYNVVQIGAQCWLKENMRATTSPSTNSNIVVTGNIYSYSGKIARWANNTDTINGLLYNWNAANDVYNASYNEVSTSTDNTEGHHKDTVFTSVNRGICPLGWHVPSHDEVLKMEYCLTTANLTLAETTTQTEKGDHALKLVSGRSWTRSKANAPGDTTKSYMNLSALSLLPIGVYSDAFKNGNTEATIWTTTQGSSTKRSAWYRIIENSKIGVSRGLGGKYVCRSVRCIRDEQQLKLGAAVVDSVACSFIETHIPVVQNVAITATAAAFTDSACTQAAGGVTTLALTGDKIKARFWNLEGNTKYYLRYTAKNLDLEDTVVVSVATQCGCLVSRALNQTDNSTYKNYEWGSTTDGVTRVDSVSDHEGNRYDVVQIGSQCWTRENGRVLTSPTTGDSILKTDNTITYSAYKREARMMYHSPARFDEIGGLYNWCAIADYESGKTTVDVPAWYANRRGLCPEGWHMTTNDEWTILKTNASSKVQQLQGGPMLANPGDSAWTTDYVSDTNRNRTGFSAPAACEWRPESPYFAVPGHSHYSAVDQYSKTDNYYYCITPTSFGTTPNEAKSHGNSYRCLRDGDIKLGELVMDSISCRSAYFHTVVKGGTIDWTKTSHRCGYSDSSAFISNTANTGTLTHSNDTIYGVIENKLTCNKRYTFYIKVYGADQQSYGVQLSDSTRDLSLPVSTSCVVSGALHTTEFSATDHSHEEGTDNTLTAVYDHQGNKYQVVQIGNQCWMRENMRATTSPSTDTTILLSAKYLSTQSKAAYYYNLDSANAKYGVLYNWCAAVDTFKTDEVATKAVTSGWPVTFTDARRGICPAGWHVPTNDEWIKMATEVGVGIGSGSNVTRLAGGCDWTSSTKAGTPGDYTLEQRNSSFFTAVPAGRGYSSEGFKFGGINTYAYFWTSTPHTTTANSYYCAMSNSNAYLSNDNTSRVSVYSVRCVRDEQLKLGAAVVDSVACTFIETHIPVVQNVALTATAAAFTDSACTQAAGGVTTTLSSVGDNVVARFWNLDGNTKYYLRYTVQNQDLEDTAMISVATQCFCTVSRALNQPADYKNYEWGSTTDGVTRVDSVSDHEGNRYSVVQIGSQCWTRENGRVQTSPTTGDTIITTLTTTNQYQREARWWQYDPSLDNAFIVYNWCAQVDYAMGAAATTTPAWYSNRQGLCPKGWHITTNDEWATVLKGSTSSTDFFTYMISPKGNSSWATSNNNSNVNLYGFTGLGCGEWNSADKFNDANALHLTTADQSAANKFKYIFFKYDRTYSTGENPLDHSHSYRCLRDGDVELGDMVMDSITCTSAHFHAVVKKGDVDWSKTDLNVCGYSTSEDYIVDKSKKVSITHSNDTIYGTITGLSCNTRYTFYIKVYDAAYQSYGVQLSDSTRDVQLEKETSCVVPDLRLSNYSSTDLSHEDGLGDVLTAVYDHQGNKYQVVQIGNQCWMRENMRATTSPRPDVITNFTQGTNTQSSNTIPYYYKSTNVNSEAVNYEKFGCLYNWAAAMDTTVGSVQLGLTGTRRGICPEGWHIPADVEWYELEKQVANTTLTNEAARTAYSASFDAGRLAGGCDWGTINNSILRPQCYNHPDRNSTLFSALPAGVKNTNGFAYVNTETDFWSSTEADATTVYRRLLHKDNNGISRAASSKTTYGFSVRCVRDVETTVAALQFSKVTCSSVSVATKMLTGIVTDTVNILVSTQSDFSDTVDVKTLTIPTDSLLSTDFYDLKTNTTYYVKIADKTANFTTQLCACEVMQVRADNEHATDGKVYEVKDADGNWYGVVQIGNQCWLRENMRCTTSPKTGNRIIANYASTISKAATWYGNDSVANAQYGLLYNLPAALDIQKEGAVEVAAANNTSTTWDYADTVYQGICPDGWHVPGDAEWTTMENYVVSDNHYGVAITPNPVFGNREDAISNNTAANFEGKNTPISQMLADPRFWVASTVADATGNTNSFRDTVQFGALPAGFYYNATPTASALNKYTAFWSSTPKGNTNSFGRQMYHNAPGVTRINTPKYNRMSVRCVRDVLVPKVALCGECTDESIQLKAVVNVDSCALLNSSKVFVTSKLHPEVDSKFTGLQPGKYYVVSTSPTGHTATDSVTILTKVHTTCSGIAREGTEISTGVYAYNEWSSATNVIDSVSDHQGNVYEVVQIGSYCWLKENMRTTKTNTGEDLTDKTGTTDKSTTEKYYYVSDKADKYGYLYNYPAANSICPPGGIFLLMRNGRIWWKQLALQMLILQERG